MSSGHNQRMEFLGDSIMQLVATEYLFIHFPDHHEGHLTVRSGATSTRVESHLSLFKRVPEQIPDPGARSPGTPLSAEAVREASGSLPRYC